MSKLIKKAYFFPTKLDEMEDHPTLTNGKACINQHNYRGPRGGKRRNIVNNGGWNVIRQLLKSLKGQPYMIKERLDGDVEVFW